MRQTAPPAFDKPLTRYRVDDARGDKAGGVAPRFVENFNLCAAFEKLERKAGTRNALPHYYVVERIHQKRSPCRAIPPSPSTRQALSVSTRPCGVRFTNPS